MRRFDKRLFVYSVTTTIFFFITVNFGIFLYYFYVFGR